MHLLLFHLVIPLNYKVHFFISQSIKVWMRKTLDSSEAFADLHVQHSIHQAQCLGTHFTNILLFKCLRLTQFRKFETYKSRILIKFLLKVLRQLSKDLLYAE